MAATRALLILFTSACLLFCLYKFTPLSDNILSPTSPQVFEDFIEALTIFKFNYIKPKFPNTALTSYNFTVTDDLEDNSVWSVIHENDVVVLTVNNFSEFVDKNRHVMVMFYEPCCYRSVIRSQAPEFAGAAKLLKGTEAVFAMVDASVEKELRIKYRIPVYPTMHLFVDGVKKNVYDSVMVSDAIVTWVKRKTTVGIYNITALNQDAVIIHISERTFVLGFLDSLEGPDSEELAAASTMQSDIDFYRTASADVAQFFHIDPHIKRPALIFRLPGLQYRYDGQFTKCAIADFVSARKDPPVITFTYKDAKSILNNPLKQLWLFASVNCSQLICAFEETAKAYRGQLLFVQALDSDNGSSLHQIAHEFGITEDVARVVAYNSRDSKKHVFNGELTLNNIKSFVEDFLKDELLRQLDPAPETVLKLPSQSNASNELH